MTKKELETFIDSVDKDEFTLFFKSHGVKTILEKYNLKTIREMIAIRDAFGIVLTKEELAVKTAVSVRESNQRKYGVDNVFQLNEIKDKIKQTCIKKYGVEYAFQSDEVKEKIKQINLEKYGVENSAQVAIVKEKISSSWKNKTEDEVKDIIAKSKQTCLEKYGVDSYTKTDDWLQKSKQTCIEKYGCEYSLQNTDVRKKCEQTCLDKYGVKSSNQAESVKKNKKETCMSKYGVENPFQIPEVKNKIKQALFDNFGIYHSPKNTYIYNDLHFDSFPEYCFYLYHIYNNIEIKHEPAEFEYLYNNKVYKYYPDFLVNSELIEIKGDQFLAADGTWCCPYDSTQNELYEAKHKCAIDNNVKILYSKDYKAYIDWFNKNLDKLNFILKDKAVEDK